MASITPIVRKTAPTAVSAIGFPALKKVKIDYGRRTVLGNCNEKLNQINVEKHLKCLNNLSKDAKPNEKQDHNPSQVSPGGKENHCNSELTSEENSFLDKLDQLVIRSNKRSSLNSISASLSKFRHHESECQRMKRLMAAQAKARLRDMLLDRQQKAQQRAVNQKQKSIFLKNYRPVKRNSGGISILKWD